MSTKKDKFSKKDKSYMELALRLASARHGHTGVNPSVGCVIVKNDEIISSFFTITQPTDGFLPVKPWRALAKLRARFI